MAIFGTIQTLVKQCNDTKLNNALQYLLDTDLSGIFENVKENNPLKIEIDGSNIFAIFQSYETKPIEDANMEGHRKYIDIQYIHSGTEQILVAPSTRIIKNDEYNEQDDIYFPKTADYSPIRLNAGMGCILHPEDIHAPCISIDAPTKIQKIVIKVAVNA